MGKISGTLRFLTNVQSLGGGSFWQGLFYLMTGLIFALFVAAFAPVILLSFVPSSVLNVVSGFLALLTFAVVVWVGATIYAKIRQRA